MVGFVPRVVALTGILALGLASVRIGPGVARAAATKRRADTAQVFVTTIPPGYRDWMLISVATIGTPLFDIRAKLGNNLAISAYRTGKIPFPDGAVIARLAWKLDTSAANNNAFRLARTGQVSAVALERMLAGSFVAGAATNLQFMVKNSRKYASTGGWGFGQFTNGKADTGAVMKTCFACHTPIKNHDFVFTQYAP